MKFLDVLPSQPTWDVIDSSKLSTYMKCPRKYFYEYVLGWRSTYPNNHLVFGTAWHLAVEHMLLNSYSKDSIKEGQYMFISKYREELPQSTDDQYSPKDPRNGLLALQEYAERFKHDCRDFEVLFTEIGGQVYIAPEESMHFRIDAVLADKQEGRIVIMDHKTSQRKMNFWQDTYKLSTQILLYLHAAYCIYGYDTMKVKGAKVRCTFFYKSKNNEFDQATVEKSAKQMNAWLKSTARHYYMLKGDMEELLNEDDTEHPVMYSFPMNTGACFDYGTQCRYFDFCNSWQNPLEKMEYIVPGFKIEFWDPNKDQVIRHRIDLGMEQPV